MLDSKVIVICCAIMMCACGDPEMMSTTADGGTMRSDSGSPTDAGSIAIDAGAPVDAGESVDTDAGVADDADITFDAGTPDGDADITFDAGTPDGDADITFDAGSANGDADITFDAGRVVDASITDPCATDDNAISTVGCNGGFLASEPAPNTTGGTCIQSEDEEDLQGSCASEESFCAGDLLEAEGVCFTACTPASTYVSTSGCPTGFRCFSLNFEYAICFRDCDATHPCPTGMECDVEGSCVMAAVDEE